MIYIYINYIYIYKLHPLTWGITICDPKVAGPWCVMLPRTPSSRRRCCSRSCNTACWRRLNSWLATRHSKQCGSRLVGTEMSFTTGFGSIDQLQLITAGKMHGRGHTARSYVTPGNGFTVHAIQAWDSWRPLCLRDGSKALTTISRHGMVWVWKDIRPSYVVVIAIEVKTGYPARNGTIPCYTIPVPY